MSTELAITGVGAVTPLGSSVETTWRALLRGDSISTHTRLPVEDSAQATRVARIATAAGREALTQAGWHPHDPQRLSLVVGTSKGPIESWIDPDRTPLPTSDNRAAAGRLDWGLAGTAAEVAAELGLPHAARITLSAACASGLHALIRAALLIRNGEADRVLVIAAEASVHALFLGSFERLGVLAPPGDRCRPFDQHRRGFLMSEAAAAVCIEPLQSDAPALVRVESMALAVDAANLVAGSADARVLRRVITQCAAVRPVDLYHAHGTGTVLNDKLELAAAEHTFARTPGPRPLIYSHKGALGHSLGAAGLLGIALSIQAHRRGEIPANVNTRSPLGAENTLIPTMLTARPIHRSITCATGFGGPIAAVTLVRAG